MSHFIAVLGSKGGAGKTTVAHLLSYGLSLSGRRVVYVLTDTWQEPIKSLQHRRYAIADGRTEFAQKKIIDICDSVSEECFVVVDGMSREPLPICLSQVLSSVILPFRDSIEDIRFLIRDWKQYPQALALPSQWSTNVWAKQILDDMISPLLKPYKDNIFLSPVPMMNASKMLLSDHLGVVPTAMNQIARQLAREVLCHLDSSYQGIYPVSNFKLSEQMFDE